MPDTIQSFTGQNILSTLISLFQDNGKKMTVAQICEEFPACMNEDEQKQILAVLDSYTGTSEADETAEDSSLLTRKIFTSPDNGIYQLTASDEVCQQILNQIGSDLFKKASPSEETERKETEISPSSETFAGTPGTSFETFDSFTETAMTQNRTNADSEGLQSLEQTLRDASDSVQEAADRAASLKTQGAAVYEETEILSSSSSAEKTRQQMSAAYQKRMEAYQNRVNELQDALDAANREKELAQNQADSSDMDAYRLQDEMQSSIDSREEVIRQYRLGAEENQKHIDDLQKALEEARESLENARIRAEASQQEIQSLRDEADAYYAYGSEVLNTCRDAADGYEERLSVMKGQLEDTQDALADTRTQADAAKAMSDDYAARLGSMQDELDQTKADFADVSSRLDAAGTENTQLKQDLSDCEVLNDQMISSYKQEMHDAQDEIAALQQALADFSAQADSLKGDISTLNADKEEMFQAYEQNIDSYRNEILSLEEDLRAAQEQLADSSRLAEENGQEADTLREESASFRVRLGDLEERLNAALQALEAARAQADQSNAETEGLKQDLSDLNAVREQMISSYKQDSDAWKNRMYTLQNALKDASQELVDTRKRADASTEQADSLKQNLADLLNGREAMIAAHQKEIDGFKNQIDTLKKALNASARNTAAASADADASRQNAEDLRHQIDSWQKCINEMQEALDASRADLARARSEADDAGARARDLRSNIENLQTEKDRMEASWNQEAGDYDTEIALLKAEMANLGDRLADSEADNADLRKAAADFAVIRDQMTESYSQDMSGYQSKIDGLQSQLDASQKNADGLQADVDTYNDFKDEMIRSYREDTDSYQNQIAALKSALSSSRADLADAMDRADAASAEADGLRREAADFEAFKKQMIASYTQDRETSDSQIDSLQNQLHSLQAALDASDKAVRDARARAENAEGDNALLQDSIDTLNTEKERIGVIYRDETGSLREQIAQLQDELNSVHQAMQEAQVRASASEQALSNANARADRMEDEAELCSSSFTEIDNSYISTIGDYQNTLDGIQAELDRAYQALYSARNTVQTTEVHVTEIRQNADGTVTESSSSTVYDDPDPIDVDIQLAEDRIARQQQKILDHQDQIDDTSSDFMKAVYQAEINHNRSVIDRQTQKLEDLKDEKKWRNQ